jgi:type IV secretion system protein VirB6/type IV secretion system protein TrbL
MRKPVNLRYLSLLMLSSFALFSARAMAAVDNRGILDTVLDRYSAAAATWGTLVTTRASWLFWTLVVISMVWTFGIMAVRKADLAEFYTEFVRFTIFTGFFWWALTNGPTFSISITSSLRQVAAEAAGVPNTLAPSGIVDIGFDIFFKVLDMSTVWKPIDSATGLVISGIVLVVFALVAVNMLLLLVSGWVLAYAGVFFLGFGGSRWTSDMAIAYYKTVLNIAAQLFTMIFLVGVGKSFVDLYYAGMSTGLTLKELSVMLIVALVLLRLVETVPGLVGSLAGAGNPALGSGFGTGAVIGAAAFASAGMATAGAALASGAAGFGGGAQALMAAFSKANAAENAGGASSLQSESGTSGQSVSGASGSGVGSPLAAAMGEGQTGAANSGSGTPASTDVFKAGLGGSGGAATIGKMPLGAQTSAKGSGKDEGSPGEVKRGTAIKALSSIAAKAGKVAVGTVGNLAVGSWDVAKEKFGDTKTSALDRIRETTGGKIAAAINAREPAEKSVSFGADSLAAADGAADRESEIAAFRDRS